MVRRAAAANMPAFISVCEADSVRSEFLPLFLSFAEDEQDSVRLLAIQSSLIFLCTIYIYIFAVPTTNAINNEN